MLKLAPSWQSALLILGLIAGTSLLVVWWRQQTRRWPIVLVVCLVAAPALSWWSGQAFQVADYRAGCDGLCPGFRGAPIPIYTGAMAGGRFLPAGFLLNTWIYIVILLAWCATVGAIVKAFDTGLVPRRWVGMAVGVALVATSFALSPWFLPPPEAHVRGDSQRVAINARREVFMYASQAPWPVLRVGLDDVRPRQDGEASLRVCLRTYTFFYIPSGALYLDMTPQGVHSNQGGYLPQPASCWE